MESPLIHNIIENRITNTSLTGNIFIWLTITLQTAMIAINSATQAKMPLEYLWFPCIAFLVVMFIGALLGYYNTN